MKKIRKFARLLRPGASSAHPDRVVLGLMRTGLWLLSFRKLIALVSAVGPGCGQPMSTSPDRIGWAIRVASRYVPGATCLVQALTGLVLLEGAGLPAHFYIGVARER